MHRQRLILRGGEFALPFLPLLTFAVACLLLLVAPSTPAWSQESKELSLTDRVPDEETRAQIESLIQQLGAEKYRDRKRAETELQSMGMVVIEPLQAVRADADTEIRLRSRRLIELLRKQFITEGLPDTIQSILRGYDELEIPQRRALLNRVADIPDAITSGALARIARVDESEELSKHAALAILNSELAISTEDRRKRQLICIGFNERAACQWIRSFVESHDAPDKALQDLKEMLLAEKALLDSGNSSTSRDIVERLSLRLVDCLTDAGLDDEAFEEMKVLALNSSGPTTTLNSLDWLIERKAWSTIEELNEEGREQFKKDALMLYRFAEAFQLADDDEMAEKMAQKAFDAKGYGLENYSGLREVMNIVLLLSSSNDPDRFRRYSIAKLLQDSRGLYGWAEREYRAALETENPEVLFDVSNSLSEMYHDLQRDAEAAEVREDILDRVEKEKGFSDVFDGSYVSRMHYYKARVANQEKNQKEEIKQFQLALKAYPDDIESLIGLYRVKDVPDEVHEHTVMNIKRVAGDYLSEIEKDRRKIKQSPRTRSTTNLSLARNENQFAWLVSNTEGDIDEAIRCSEHSLEVSPGDAGYQDTLGRCYYKKGDFKKAIEVQAAAAKGAPHTKQIQRQLSLFEGALAAKESQPEQDSDSKDDSQELEEKEPAEPKQEAPAESDAESTVEDAEDSVPVPN